MSGYLTKEEIKQWRSSTEKCTLEEYAAKLGKLLNPEKETNDIVDIINNGQEVSKVYVKPIGASRIPVYERPKETTVRKKPARPEPEKAIIKEISQEQEVKKAPVFVEKTPIIKEEPIIKPQPQEEVEQPAQVVETKTPIIPVEKPKAPAQEVTFKKNLTDREQKVFDHLYEKRGETVYAKDLAEMLELKRDYIYKYIKNLRTKINEDVLINSEKGGFCLDI